MNILYLIIIYGVICVCMIIFNICAIIYSKGSNKINDEKNKLYKTKIKEELKRIEEGKNVEESHLKFLKRKLRNSNNLMIFDSIVNRYKIRENKYLDTYLKECSSILTDLLYSYDKKTNTEMAYYLSVIKDYNLLKDNNSKELISILYKTLLDENFYCRDNAFLAICKLGDAKKLYKALVIIDRSKKFYHRNLIYNGLSISNCNKDEFIKLIMKNFDKFKTNIKCCIIDYLSYNNNQYSAYIYSLLLVPNPRNLKISAIKYFGIVRYEEAEKVLITYVNKYLNSDMGDLDFCISCVKSLRNYNSKNSMEIIMKAIYAKNYRIRNIACESLAVIRLGINPSDLEDMELEEDINIMYNYHIKRNIKKVVK